jgi:rod shape-determining protein MreD
MGLFLGIPLLALLAVLQSTVMNSLLLLDGRLDLVLLAVVSWGVAGRPEEAMVWGLFGGLFLDLFSGVPLGSHAIVLVLVTFLVSLMQGRFWQMQFFMPLGVMLLSSVAYHLLGLSVLFILGREIDFEFSFSRIILPSTFLNIAAAIPVYNLVEGVQNRLFPPEVEL